MAIRDYTITDNNTLPYSNTDSLVLTYINLNDFNTSYTLTKAFVRLLANDKFLSTFMTLGGDTLITPFFDNIVYDRNARVFVNVTAPYSTNPRDKFKIVKSLQDNNTVKPTNSNTVPYYAPPKEEYPNSDRWITDTFELDLNSLDYKYLKPIPLQDQQIPALSSYIKSSLVNIDTSSNSNNIDYIVKTVYTKTPITIYASTTTLGNGVILDPSRKIEMMSTTWYRLYKSGYVECGGISRPFSLTEQWNGNFGKSLLKFVFPIEMNCINVNYTVMGFNNNFMTMYDDKYSTDSIIMSQIIEGRQSPKNYVYNSLNEAPNANPGNNIQYIDNIAFVVQINNESYDLDNGGLGQYDSNATRISWTASGILV